MRGVYNSLRRLYRRLFQRAHDSNMRQVKATLQRVPMFRELSRGTLRELAEGMHRRTYQRDEYIYYENDPGLGLYVVQRGRVRLLVEDESGGVHELRQAGEHQVIGDLSILGDYRRTETVQAATEVQVLGFFQPDLQTLKKRNPGASIEVLTAIARHLAMRQVELIRLLGEHKGKVTALRLIESARQRSGGTTPEVPAFPE